MLLKKQNICGGIHAFEKVTDFQNWEKIYFSKYFQFHFSRNRSKISKRNVF